MDLYRYFHPHHNPRLRNTPLRLQELAELQQAAVELTRALKRAFIRSSRIDESQAQQCFGSAIEAANVLVTELEKISAEFPDDSLQTMRQLLTERAQAPGWETWAKLLEQRLIIEESEQHPELSKFKRSYSSGG